MSRPANEEKLKLLNHPVVARAEVVFLRGSQRVIPPNSSDADTVPVGVNVLFLSFSSVRLHAVAIQHHMKRLVSHSINTLESK